MFNKQHSHSLSVVMRELS